MSFVPGDMIAALPEVYLAVASLILLLIGVVRQGNDAHARLVAYLGVLALAITGVLVLQLGGARAEAFGGLFVTDRFAIFMKTLILIGSALSILVSLTYNRRRGIEGFEFPILVLFATVGMMAMVSANNLLSLYVGLELQSLALYVLAAIRRDDAKSSEAGLKYFVLGALSSGMLLFGASLIYGFGGSTSFDKLAGVLTGVGTEQIGLIVGIVFLSVGIAFKCSAVPFHMWTPDVYEGAPTPVTAFFAVAPKTAAIALFLRVFLVPLGHLSGQWQDIIWTISLLSMALGSYAAISQSNIKRLMAYSSIGHVGYALMGLAAATPAGVEAVLVYMAIYLFMTLGAFTVILCMERNGHAVEQISDLSGLSRTRPLMALALAVFMFSLAGVPPLAGFFSKILVFMAAINAHLYTLAILGVLTSVIGCYYYIRVIKVMYFDEPAEPLDTIPDNGAVRIVMALSTVIVLVLFAFMGSLSSAAAAASHALFLG